jgi:membrane associated rhomboid family serine protease
MLPLRDNIAAFRYPIVNTSLILANVAAFFFEMTRPHLQQFVLEHSMVASRLLHHFDFAQLGTSFSSMFMHGSVAHLFGNLWILYIFGDNVEDELGHWKYLLFYLACGLAADATQILVNPAETLPSLGASGAIAGVLAAYLVLYPKAEVQTQVLLWYPMVRAWVIIGGWFLINCFCGYFQLDQSIGWFAHIGGFIFGAILIVLFTNREKRERFENSVNIIPAMNWMACTLLAVTVSCSTLAVDVMTYQLVKCAPYSESTPVAKPKVKAKVSTKSGAQAKPALHRKLHNPPTRKELISAARKLSESR